MAATEDFPLNVDARDIPLEGPVFAEQFVILVLDKLID